MTLPINEENGGEPTAFETDKNLTWENNHTLITRSMATLLRQNERIPTKAEIAEHTGLSRQTVHKHVKELGPEIEIEEQLEHFNFMSSKVLAKIVELAMDGDVKAARLSLEIMGILKNKNSGVNIIKQNNVIVPQ